jgi:RNA polymerase sigma-70 factor, ECF subfamily
MGRPRTPAGDDELLEGLRAGDEEAFVAFVGRHNHTLFYVARSFVQSDAIAEEVVQDTWMAVVRGLSKFEGRCSIKTWLVSIAVNRARSTATRESRVRPLSSSEAAVDPNRFDTDGQWITPPEYFVEDAEDRVIAGLLAESIRSSLENLPESQLQVVNATRCRGT